MGLKSRQKARLRAFKEQEGRCFWCGCLMWEPRLEALSGYESRVGWIIDYPGFVRCTAEHITPRSQGGGDGDNIAAACAWCNHTRHNRRYDLTIDSFQTLVRKRVEARRWNVAFAPYSIPDLPPPSPKRQYVPEMLQPRVNRMPQTDLPDTQSATAETRWSFLMIAAGALGKLWIRAVAATTTLRKSER